MKVAVAVLSKEDESVVEEVLDVLQSFRTGQPLNFGLITPKMSLLNKNLALLSKQSAEASVLAGYATTQSNTSSRYDFLQLDNAFLFFEGKIFNPVSEKAGLEQLITETHKCEVALHTLMKEADGVYSFFLLNNAWIAVGRDPMGIQPLYYGENSKLAAFATNRKVLWKIGIENISSFPPGNISFLNKSGFKFKVVKTLTFSKPVSITIDQATDQLKTILYESVRRRVKDLKKVAVAFSGGLDSSLIAFIAREMGVNVSLLHVSLENEIETEVAIQAAEALNLPLHVDLYKDSDVEKILPKVVRLIEESDPVKTAIGVPFFWVSEKTAEAGYKILLAGQGADELFGGYQRYVAQYCQEGNESTQKMMFRDVTNIHKSNLERDMKITSFNDVELRLPFGSYDLAEFALSLPLEYKIEPKPDTLRKLILRKLAVDLGLPSFIVEKPKKAVQYGTGINNAIKRIAKNNGKTVNEYIIELFERSSF